MHEREGNTDKVGVAHDDAFCLKRSSNAEGTKLCSTKNSCARIKRQVSHLKRNRFFWGLGVVSSHHLLVKSCGKIFFLRITRP